MKILIACEESQTVCKAFRKKGHEAYSCDILDCSGGHPEWHIKGDVLKVITNTNWGYGDKEAINFETQDETFRILNEKGWEMMIAHPPCTYLSNAGAVHLYPKGVLNKERYKNGLVAKEFFMRLLSADIPKIVIENPIQSKIYKIPKYNQTIQPYQFGHPFSKKTCLWLKGLPELKPTKIIPKESIQSTKIAGNWFNKGGKERQINRSKTFQGIADAMAEQWG